MTHVLLILAIVSEVVGTISLKFAQGFTRLLPSVLVFVGYGAAFVLLSIILSRGLPLGVIYGIWAASGVALVAIIGVLFLGETLTWIQGMGLVLVVGGVLAVEMGGGH